MEFPSQNPINPSFGGVNRHEHTHLHHHDHPIPSSITSGIRSSDDGNNNGPSILSNSDDQGNIDHNKKVVKYKECLKNHAASIGGNATDGCGEFMPGGEEGTLQALTCSACNCHRNFHRKEVEGEPSSDNFLHSPNRVGKKVTFGHNNKTINLGPLEPSLVYPSRAMLATHQQMIMPYHLGSSLSFPSDQSDDQQEDNRGGVLGRPQKQHMRKRFRTKFTQDQKEKMLNFAEKVGWKIQKQEDDVVQQFCQEIGVKRKVLKVWMHNNKHNLATKKNNPPTS